ncbi:SGNH/GDSL hydrolase family protein [Streptomyces sp. NPDC055607]
MKNHGGRFSFRRIAVALGVSALSLTTLPMTATAAPNRGEPTIISMGDSFIAGTAGRWLGNSNDPFGDRNKTDRAFYLDPRWGPTYDDTRVYGSSGSCFRSDTAEIKSAAIPYEGTKLNTVNLACSGATAKNVLSTAAGGQSFKGEAPQGDQLVTASKIHDVHAIVLSIGGNDMGFSDIIASCIGAYMAPFGKPCLTTQQATFDKKIDGAMALLDKTIKDIRRVMKNNGYTERGPDRYSLVVQSYPSPLPRASETRYPEGGIFNQRIYQGCPLFNKDLTWARDTMVPRLSSRISEVVKANGADFLDLSDAFQGHETCSTSTRVADSKNLPLSATMDWSRYFNTAVFQGAFDESFHPNAFGQRALGNCLNKWWFENWMHNSGATYKCVPGGRQHDQMVLSYVPAS